MAVKTTFKLDQKTIDQVLAAAKRGKLPTGSATVRSSTAQEDVKEYMKKRGLEAWHGHLSKHLGIKTVASLRATTAIDLRRMATAANMRVDQKTIDQVLQAIRRNVDGDELSYHLETWRVVREIQTLARRGHGGLVGSWPRFYAAVDGNAISRCLR
jgi:ribosomal protein L12E/L44/L45/RPP1/RPP2